MKYSRVKVFEHFNNEMKLHGYAPIKKPTEKESRALLGLIKAFDRLDYPILKYISVSISNWERVRSITSDKSIGAVPTLTDLCVKRLEIMKAFSIMETNKTTQVIFSQEDLDKGKLFLSQLERRSI